jgi:CubicO group peptidase (beta-lactamase class C family)
MASTSFARKFFPGLLIFLLTTSLYAQSTPVTGVSDPGLKHISEFMTGYMDMYGVAAATLEIRHKNGDVLLHQGYGWLDTAKTKPTPPDAMLRIMSISKSFTQLAIKQLTDANIISPEARAFCLSNETPSGHGCLLRAKPAGNDGQPDARARNITLRHLVEHQAGWIESSPDANGLYEPMSGAVRVAALLKVPSPPTWQQMIDYQLDQALDYTPGTNSQYSNFGYVVLSHIIEKYSGLGFMEYIYQHITDPLNIPRSEIELGSEFMADRNAREPRYISTDGVPVQNLFEPAGPLVQRPDGGMLIKRAAGTGGLISSTGALLDYMQAYWLFDPAPRDPEETGLEWVRAGGGDGSLVYAVQNSPFPGHQTQADWVVILDKRPAGGDVLHENLRSLIRNVLGNGISLGDNSGSLYLEQFFTLQVPAGSANLRFETQGGTGDIDLHARAGAKPTATNYDCSSLANGTRHSCVIASPVAGIYYLRLYANDFYSDVVVTATYDNAAAATVRCSVNYQITNDWGSGYQADITVTNNGSTDISGYELKWAQGPGEAFNYGWNALYTVAGTNMTASNTSNYWNGVIKANGGKVSFGFVGKNTAAPADRISGFTLNGTACN